MRGQWHVWDPKITTPPALYVVTWTLSRLSGRSSLDEYSDQRIFRGTNLLASVVLLYVIWELVAHFSKEDDDGHRRAVTVAVDGVEQDRDGGWANLPRGFSNIFNAWFRCGELNHNVTNVWLFPPLFFFYGLYYTDVLSVLSVLLTYLFHLKHRRTWVIACGLVSLAFRQTNVFWVSIYLGAMQVQQVLPRHNDDVKVPIRKSLWDVIESSWREGCVYDPFLSEASLEGMTHVEWY